MALNIPESAAEVAQRSKTDVQRALPESNPFLKNSWLGAIITAFSNRIFDFYLQLNEAIKQSLPDTATDDFLARWASIWGVSRLPAIAATGNVIATGTSASNIPISTLYVSSDGLIYESTAAAVITAAVDAITSITRSGTTATVTTTAPHALASNVSVTIAGAVEIDYNGTYGIQVVDDVTFTYQVANAPTTPATGTITAAYDSAVVPVISQGFGQANNQVQDAVLTLQSPIAGVDDSANTDPGDIGGGTDQETDGDLRLRFLDRIQNPIAHFNVAEITAKAKEVPGVTRVFVEEVTPVVGQVTIYFMRDNDANPIPSGSEVTTVKNKILEIKPANTSDANVIVAAPIPVTVNYTFTALSPNTATMQDAIDTNLRQFFDESAEVSVNIDEDAYRSAIFNTVDLQTGDTVQSFVLSTPTGDVAITTGQIGVLGATVYP